MGSAGLESEKGGSRVGDSGGGVFMGSVLGSGGPRGWGRWGGTGTGASD